MKHLWLILSVAALAWAQTAEPQKKARDLKYEKDPGPITPASTGVAIPRSYALIIGVGDYKNLPPAPNSNSPNATPSPSTPSSSAPKAVTSAPKMSAN